MVLTLRRSETDPDGAGTEVALPHGQHPPPHLPGAGARGLAGGHRHRVRGGVRLGDPGRPRHRHRHRSAAVLRGYVRRGGLFLDNAASKVGL
jgi:hypothetical protein